MASIQKRGKKYCVIYRIYNDEGKAQQKWETYDTEAAAKKRKLEVEYKLSVGTFEVPKCVTVKEIADLLNIKLSLVKYRVSKAKELLAKQLEVEKL